MYYETLKAHEQGLISVEQANWLINSHATLSEALMHIFQTTNNEKIRKVAETALETTTSISRISADV
jgi:hypothetical protein